MSGDLTGKLALITGGGRGIGRAIALELARRGADVLINYVRHPEAARSAATEIDATTGRNAEALRGQRRRSSPASSKLFADIRDRFGYLDILINNSASGVNRPVDGADPAPLGLDPQRQRPRCVAVRARRAYR